MAAGGYAHLEKVREAIILLGHPGVMAYAVEFNARRLTEIDALEDTTEIR
jgi:hypothetical protein